LCAARPIFTEARRGDHSSRSRIAPGLQQPTRGSQPSLLQATAFGPGQPSPPIWPCSTRGFPCPRHCWRGGGLLPHLFTLAMRGGPYEASSWFCRKPAAEAQAALAVCFLWHFP